MQKVFSKIAALNQSALSMVPQNRFGDLVEVALRVEQSTTDMYQSRQESKRSAPGTSQQSSSQYNRKKSNG